MEPGRHDAGHVFSGDEEPQVELGAPGGVDALEQRAGADVWRDVTVQRERIDSEMVGKLLTNGISREDVRIAQSPPQLRQAPAQAGQWVVRVGKQFAAEFPPGERTVGQQDPGEKRPRPLAA